MFQTTRLKLTAWYLLIIMLICAFFSVVIYGLLTDELNRVEKIQKQRQELMLPFDIRSQYARAIDLEVINETKDRIKYRLFLINLGIFLIAGLAGYFLAGRTLKPIKEMVDEQSRFISDASHELRTPITALKSEIEVNLRDKKLPDASKEILSSNLEEVNHLQNLTDNLIKLSRYQKGNGSDFEKLSISKILTAARVKVTTLAKLKKISINNPQVKNLNVTGNEASLVELFTILLDNAIKYSPNNSTVTLATRKIDHSVIVSVTDEGIGIKKEEIPHLFDRFYRANPARGKHEVEGYGLGLSIAEQIIKKHHGQIKVESEEGVGSTFFVRLPS